MSGTLWPWNHVAFCQILTCLLLPLCLIERHKDTNPITGFESFFSRFGEEGGDGLLFRGKPEIRGKYNGNSKFAPQNCAQCVLMLSSFSC